MRIYHRYLGFFLAGIMAVYAISGVVMIFRNTDFLKHEVVIAGSLAPDLTAEQAAKELRLRSAEVKRTEGDVLHFADATYDPATGATTQTRMNLPYVLNKMTSLHKASTRDGLFYFNIFFGLSLLFFVVSAFWMFLPNTAILRRGLLFSAVGVVLTLILLFV